MDVQVELLNANLIDKAVNLTLQLVGEKETRLYGSLAETGGAGLFYVYIHSRSNALTCNLHQSELRQRQYVVACSVFLHVLAHALVEHLPVFCQIHVDEVHDDDSAHIAQSELSCQLVSSSEIHLQCVALLSFFRSGSVAAVHVYHVHCLGVFDDEVSAMLIVHRFSEARLNLLSDVKVVKDRHITVVQFHNACLFRGNQRYVFLHLVEHLLVVDVDVLVRWVKQVAQKCYHSACLLVDELRSCLCLLYLCNGILPSLQEDFQFGVEFCHSLSLSHSPYNNAHVLGLDALDELFQSGSLFAAFNFRRNRNFIVEWYQDQVSACKTQFGRKSWPFGRYRFFHYLHQHFLVFLQQFGDAAVFLHVWKPKCL